MCICAYRKQPLRVSVCFPPSCCECLNGNSTGHLLQMAPQLTSTLSGGRTPCPPPTSPPSPAPWFGAAQCPDGRQRMGLTLICNHPHTETHALTQRRQQSHPLSSLSSRFPALLPTMLRPRFVLSSTYPPSVVSCLAQVDTVGLLSIQGVSLDRIICCSVYCQMSPVFMAHAKLETDLRT